MQSIRTSSSGKSSRACRPQGLVTALFIFLAIAMVFSLMISCTTVPPQSGAGSLVDLVRRGDKDSLKRILDDRERLRDTVNQRDDQGLYPLHYAVSQDDSQIIELLMVFGAKPDVQDPSGKTPLRYAIDRGKVENARILVQRDAGLFIVDASGTSPAEAALASRPEVVQAVFTSRNINTTGPDGRTALHIASDRLLKDTVPILLNLGAQALVRDRAGKTPLDLVLLHPEKIESAIIAEQLILKGASPTYTEFAWFARAVKATDYNSILFDNDNTPLHEAVSRQQKGFIFFLLDRKININAGNRTRNTALHEAVRTGWVEGAQLLLAAGADPNMPNAVSDTPLLIPMPDSARIPLIRLLLQNKADPSLANAAGDTALHMAVKGSYPLEALVALTQAGAKINTANADGDTPLIIAVRLGNVEYARALVERDADIFVQNLAKESALSLAVKTGASAVEPLLTKNTVIQRDNQGNGVVATAVLLDAGEDVLALMLSRAADPNMRNNARDTAFHIAVRNNREGLGRLLAASRADIFPENSKGESPLTLALQHARGPLDWFFTPEVLAMRDTKRNSPMHYASRRNLPTGIEYLNRRDSSLLGALNIERQSPVHAAVGSNATEALRALLALGSSADAADIAGNAPLHIAVASGSIECMKILILAGASVDTRNKFLEAPLHKAVQGKSALAVTTLLNHGAKTETRDTGGLTPLAVAVLQSAREPAAVRDAATIKDLATSTELAMLLMKAGAVVDARDAVGKTPLLHAVEGGAQDLTRLFVTAGADIHAKDKDSATPFSKSLGKGIPILRELVAGANSNRSDSEGRSPLRLLVDAGMSVTHVETVLLAGGRTDSRDMFSKTALHAALSRKDYILGAKLIQSGADLFAPDAEMRTPAELALESGEEAIRAIVQAATVKDMPGIRISDPVGNSLLHYAARQGRASAVSFLLSLGADTRLKNSAGETAYDVAFTQKQKAVMDILAGK